MSELIYDLEENDNENSLGVIKSENLGEVKVNGRRKTHVAVYRLVENSWIHIGTVMIPGWAHSPLERTTLAEQELNNQK